MAVSLPNAVSNFRLSPPPKGPSFKMGRFRHRRDHCAKKTDSHLHFSRNDVSQIYFWHLLRIMHICVVHSAPTVVAKKLSPPRRETKRRAK